MRVIEVYLGLRLLFATQCWTAGVFVASQAHEAFTEGKHKRWRREKVIQKLAVELFGPSRIHKGHETPM